MGKRFIINLSRESLDNTPVEEIIEPSVNENTVIDPVELQNYVDEEVEKQEAIHEEQNTNHEIDRLEDIATSMEQIADILRPMNRIMPKTRAMVNNAFRLSVAGTGADIKRILPGFESIGDGYAAAEGIMKKVTLIKNSIADMRTRIGVK